jgi:peptidoglycan/xylan/chitin deacetylase (PgdA/CDA1 family)
VPTRLVRPLVGAVLACAALAAAASASKPPRAPLSVTSASLEQAGRELVWSVELNGRFSAAGLKRDHRSLCLLIEPGGPSHSLCVAPVPHGIELIYGPLKPRPRVIAASITRSGAERMTATFLPAAVGLRYVPVHWQVASGFGIMTTEYPSSPALAKLHPPKLVGCEPSGPSLVYGGSPARKEIALTFDDGPWPDPPAIDFVNLLARYHAPATFFEIGRQIPEFDPTGSIERTMLADGDMIGDHTWSHPNMAALSPATQTSEIEMAAGAIRHATGFTPCLWRAPYGGVSPQLEALARSLGFLTINWNIDPRDWALPGVGAIEANVLANARNGGIVEMHFGGGPRYETIDSLPTIIDTLRARGYRFVSLATMLGLRLFYK